MDKIDLSNVTFTIPIRIDSKDRLNNLYLIIDYLLYYFNTNIIIGEESYEPIIKPIEGVEYIHYPTDSFLMHRTKILNDLAKKSKTEIIVNYDTDVLLYPKKYLESVNLIKKGFDFVYPYNGIFLNVSREFYDILKETKDLDSIINNKFNALSTNSVGGCVFWKKDSFLAGGGENESFISWGFEDNERLIRFDKLGFKHSRLEGPLYHMDHERHINSDAFHSNIKINEDEFLKINSMSKTDLEEYIKTWKH